MLHQTANLPSPHPTTSFWQDPPSPFLLHHRTTPSLPDSASVVIIGSGISGAVAARRLAEGGLRDVVMLDAREACSAATGRNGGHCQPIFYGKPRNIAEFEYANFKDVSNIIQENNIPCEWEQVAGACHAFFSRRFFDEAKAEVMALKKEAPELGNMLDIVEDNDALAKLRILNAVGVIVQARAAKLAPYKLVTWLLETLIKRSTLNVQTTTPVTSISSGTDYKWSVNTSRGSIETEHILLATNGYTSYLLPQFASLIVPVQGEMSALKPPSFLEDNPLEYSYGFVAESAKNSIQDDYLIQRPKDLGGQLMYGGGRALAKNQGVNTDNDDSIDPAAARYLKMMLGHYLHLNDEADSKVKNQAEDCRVTSGLTAEREWTGIMGYSRDSVPWVGGVPGMEGVWLCGGYTGHGMVNANLSASHAANLILAAYAGKDWRLEEEAAIERRAIPWQYVISAERMSNAQTLVKVRPGGMARPGDAQSVAQSNELRNTRIGL